MTLNEAYREVWTGKIQPKSVNCCGCKRRYTATFKATDKYIRWVCSLCGIHNSISNQLKNKQNGQPLIPYC